LRDLLNYETRRIAQDTNPNCADVPKNPGYTHCLRSFSLRFRR
jgi:hypothetical protein